MAVRIPTLECAHLRDRLAQTGADHASVDSLELTPELRNVQRAPAGASRRDVRTAPGGSCHLLQSLQLHPTAQGRNCFRVGTLTVALPQSGHSLALAPRAGREPGRFEHMAKVTTVE